MSGVEGWPTWASERVEIVRPDPRWPARAEQERHPLERALGRWLLGRVEHIGSTAVPGLPAKPVLDLQAPVADLGCADEVAAALEPLGWHLVPPELDGRAWRRLFVKVVDGRRAAHLHVLARDGSERQQHLDFRDALRADPALAAAYGDLKIELARRHADDREAYTEGKHAFVREGLASSGGNVSGLAVRESRPRTRTPSASSGGLMPSGHSPADDLVYDLVSVQYHALKAATTYDQYIKDAHDHEDVRSFFEQCAQQDAQRAEQCHQLLGQLTAKGGLSS